MSAMKSKTMLKSVIVVGSLSLLLSGCDLTYLTNSDQITPGAGNAVNANIEGQTIDPSSDAQYNVHGLGADGSVVPPPENPAGE